MKTVIKIEAILLAVVILAAAVLLLISAGALMWIKEPVTVERQTAPIATDVPAEPVEEPEATQEPETAQEPARAEASDPEELTEPREITAKNYFVYDVREGEYLQQKGDLNAKLYPASITKLLSVYVLLQHMDPEDTVVVGDALTLVQEDSSVANLLEGDELTVSQLIAGMMLPSGNDAAQVMAVAAGRKIAGNNNLSPEEASKIFVQEMNKQAAELGMTESHFVNADGFHDDNHYTSMSDLVTLSCKILADPAIVEYTSTVKKSVVLGDRTEKWRNTNALLNPEYEYFIPGTIGLKTGYTGEAGGCLVSAFYMGDRLLIIGVFGCPAYTEDRYLDTAELYNNTVI